MDASLPVGNAPVDGLIDRRQGVRWPVLRPIVGHASPTDRKVMLHDIGADGFAARADMKLTLGVAYDFQFAIPPYTVLVTARLAHAMQVSGDQGAGYLLGFQFVETQRDEAAIAALIAKAKRSAA